MVGRYLSPPICTVGSRLKNMLTTVSIIRLEIMVLEGKLLRLKK
jgi:hypothetical protein